MTDLGVCCLRGFIMEASMATHLLGCLLVIVSIIGGFGRSGRVIFSVRGLVMEASMASHLLGCLLVFVK